MAAQIPNIRPDILPMGSFGAVKEVSQAALLLARNGYITGPTINGNGGCYLS